MYIMQASDGCFAACFFARRILVWNLLFCCADRRVLVVCVSRTLAVVGKECRACQSTRRTLGRYRQVKLIFFLCLWAVPTNLNFHLILLCNCEARNFNQILDPHPKVSCIMHVAVYLQVLRKLIGFWRREDFPCIQQGYALYHIIH